MGLTNRAGGAPTFFVPPTVTYDPSYPLDANGEAFSWASVSGTLPSTTTLPSTVLSADASTGTGAKTVVQPAGVQVPCAVSWASGQDSPPDGRRMGDFEIAYIVITVLDVDYALIEGANRVKIDDAVYEIRYRQPSVGLFDVTVWTLHAYTANED